MDLIMITGVQVRAALGLLNWSVAELAKKSGLGTTTINSIKQYDGIKPNAGIETLSRVRSTIINGINENRVLIASEVEQGKINKNVLAVFDSLSAPIANISVDEFANRSE